MKPQTPPPSTPVARPQSKPAKPAPPSDALPCPVCGTLIEAPRGSKAAICRVCGFKDSCCY